MSWLRPDRCEVKEQRRTCLKRSTLCGLFPTRALITAPFPYADMNHLAEQTRSLCRMSCIRTSSPLLTRSRSPSVFICHDHSPSDILDARRAIYNLREENPDHEAYQDPQLPLHIYQHRPCVRHSTLGLGPMFKFNDRVRKLSPAVSCALAPHIGTSHNHAFVLARSLHIECVIGPSGSCQRVNPALLQETLRLGLVPPALQSHVVRHETGLSRSSQGRVKLFLPEERGVKVKV